MKYLKVWAICHGDWHGVYTPVIGEGMNEGLCDSAAVILKWLFEMSSQTSSNTLVLLLKLQNILSMLKIIILKSDLTILWGLLEAMFG